MEGAPQRHRQGSEGTVGVLIGQLKRLDGGFAWCGVGSRADSGIVGCRPDVWLACKGGQLIKAGAFTSILGPRLETPQVI